MSKTGRNDPCPCGSGKKYKKCCLNRESTPAGLPKMMTASGEEISFRQARYDVLDFGKVITRLNQAPDFDADEPEPGGPEEVGYAWLETGESAKLMKTIKGRQPLANPLLGNPGEDGPFRLLGDIKLKSQRLIFNAVGEQRFKLGKRRLESLLGDQIKHRLDSIRSMTSALAGINQSGGGFKPLIPEPMYDCDPDDPKFAPLASGESLQDALKNREFGSLDEANAFLQVATDQYNNQPQADMGGLSPIQVRGLMDCDWEDPQGPIRLNKTLSLEELQSVPLLHNARLLLSQAEQKGGIKATGAGYLDTAFVREMIFQGKWPERWSDEYQKRAQGRLREMDIRHLYSLRLICSFSGLLKKKANSFEITYHGRQMLSEEYAGRLFKRLFFIHFQELNLDLYDRYGLEYPEIQTGVVFSIHQLSRLTTGEWLPLAELAPRLLLPSGKRALTSTEDHTQWNGYQSQGVVHNLGYRLIEPLEIFGLVQTRDLKSPLLDLSVTTEFKLTELYNRLIAFDL